MRATESARGGAGAAHVRARARAADGRRARPRWAAALAAALLAIVPLARAGAACVAEYKLDETSGLVVHDTSGNGFDGAIDAASGFAWDGTGGWDGGCLRCPGSHPQLTLPEAAALQPAHLGVSFWVKRTCSWAGVSNQVFVWAKGADMTSWLGNGYYIECHDADNAHHAISISVGTGISWYSADPDVFYPLDQWVHIFVEYDSATKTAAIAKNGVALGLQSAGVADVITPTVAPRGVWMAPYAGAIDLLRFYDTPAAGTAATMAREKAAVWNGGGGDDNWSTGANWVAGVPPSAGDNLVFTGATRPNPVNDLPANTSFRSITFLAGGFAVTGADVRLTDGVANASGANTVGLNVTMTQAQSFDAADGTTLTIAGTIANGGYDVTCASAGTVNLAGAIGGAGGLTRAGTGLTVVSGPNTYAGATTVTGGVLRAAATVQPNVDGAFGHAASAIALDGGYLESATATFSRDIAATSGWLGTSGGARTVASSITASGTLWLGERPLVSVVKTGDIEWRGALGVDGYALPGDTIGWPAYVTPTLIGNSLYVWTASTADTRAPQNAAGTDRLAGTWFSDSAWTLRLAFTDGNAHQVTFYCLDWDTSARAQRMDATDVDTGVVISSVRISDYGTQGALVTYRVRGTVDFTFTREGTYNAVISAVFFDPVPSSDQLTLAGAVGGAGSLVVDDAAVAMVGNGYGGRTTVLGSLTCGAPGVMPSTRAVTIGGDGTFALGGFAQTIGALSGRGRVALGAGTLTCESDGSTSAYDGVVAGSGNLAKAGAGALTLTGTSTFTGLTQVDAGTLVIGSASALGGNGSVGSGTTVASGATLRWDGTYDIGAEYLTLAGSGVGGLGALYCASTATAACSGTITLTGTATIGNDSPFALALSGPIGGGALRKTGSGALTLTATNGYTGATTVDGGVLQIGGPSGGIAASSAVAVAPGATLLLGDPIETVWFDDAPPAGATTGSVGPDAWALVAASPAPLSGSVALQSAIAGGWHENYFYGATTPITISAGDVLSIYAYLDPANPPSELMVEWHGLPDDWQHRAMWGEDDLPMDRGFDQAHHLMGPLPPLGQWVHLEVAAESVGLVGRPIDGLSMAAFNGRVTYDRFSVHRRGTVRLGAGWPNRIGDTAPIALNAGTLVMTAQDVDRAETFGVLTFGSGASAISALSTAGGVPTLTAADLARAGGGTLAFARGAAPPYGKLMSTNSLGNTANLALLPWSSVTQAGTTAPGQYTTANGLVQETWTGTTYTSNGAYGRWHIAGTWNPAGGPPTANDDAIISAGDLVGMHDDILNVPRTDATVRSLYMPVAGSVNQAGTLNVSRSVNFGGSSMWGCVTSAGLDFHGNEGVINHTGNGWAWLYWGASLAGTNGMAKTGPGNYEVNGVCHYTGVTDIEQGRWRVSVPGALSGSSTVVHDSASLDIENFTEASQPLTLSGAGADGLGALLGIGATAGYGGAITLAADSSLSVEDESQFAVSGAIGGAHGVTTAGYGGVIVLSGASTYSGTTTLASGATVRVAADAVSGAAGAFGQASSAVVGAGGTLEIATATVTRPISVTSGLRIDAYGQNRVLGSAITGAYDHGLVGTYVATNLRSVNDDDWRLSQTIAATRLDPLVSFGAAFGSPAERAAWGIGGNDWSWEQFSVQWDGWLVVPLDGTTLVTRSDDGSRVWLDLDGNGRVDDGEWRSNSWGGIQSATTVALFTNLAAGTYRIRVQYEQGWGGIEMHLGWSDALHSAGTDVAGWPIVPTSCLLAASPLRLGGGSGVSQNNDGLLASVVPWSMRSVLPHQADWRVTQPISGSRLDAVVAFPGRAWGTEDERLRWHVSNGSWDWDEYSMQWDGYITIPVAGTVLKTASDDASRVWLSGNGDPASDASWGSNGWGGGQSLTMAAVSAPLAAGTYQIRVQYEEGVFDNACYLLWDDAAHSGGTLSIPSGTAYIVPAAYLSQSPTGSMVTSGQPLLTRGAIGGALELTKIGPSIAAIGAACSYSGQTIVSAGTLALAANDVLPDATDLRIAGGAAFDCYGWSDTVGSLTGSGALRTGGGRLSVGANGLSTLFAGIVSGGGGITKVGAGTLTLTGASTCTGATVVAAGTLEVAGSLAASAVPVTGAKLSGTGSVGAILAGDGGVIAPGTAAARGILTGSSASVSAAGTVRIRVAGYTTAGVDYDALHVTGSLVAAGATLEADLDAWGTQDIGSVGIVGTSTIDLDSGVIQGSGDDIWTAADAFRYTYQRMDGDGSMTMRIASMTAREPFAKIGLMIRNGLAADSRFVHVIRTPSGVVRLEARGSDGAAAGLITDSGATTFATPMWLRLTRLGSTIVGWTSTDGVSWSVLGSTTLALGTPCLIGVCATAHRNADEMGTASVDHISWTGAVGLATTGTCASVITFGSRVGKFSGVRLVNNPRGYTASLVYHDEDAVSPTPTIDLVLTPALIAWYKLDEAAGTFVADSSGNGHDGTLGGGGTWRPYGGAIGGALTLTGGAQVALDTSTALQPSSLTVSMWIKRTTDWSTIDQEMVWAKDNADWASNGWYIQVLDNGGAPDRALGFVIDGEDSFWVSADANTLYPMNTWVFVAATFDSASQTVKLYVNGASQPLVTWLPTPMSITGTADLKRIGHDGPDGTLDDIRIYGQALSQDEITALYAAGRSTRTWDGGGVGNLWTTAANWVGDVAPNAGDDLEFAGAVQPTNVDDFAGGTAFRSLLFSAGGFSLNAGSAITLTAGITNNVGANAIADAITLAADQAIATASGATTTLSGAITTAGHRLYADGAGATTIAGAIDGGGGAGGVTQRGSGTLTLAGGGAYTGATSLIAGTLEIDGAQPSSAVSLTAGTLRGTGTLGAISGVARTTADIRPGTAGARGTLKAASADLSSGLTLRVRVAATTTPGTDYDRLDLGTASGALTLAGTAHLVVDLAGLASTGTATGVVTCAGRPVGVFNDVVVLNNTHGWIVEPIYLNGRVDLKIAPHRAGNPGGGYGPLF